VEFQHIQGQTNIVADALSRSPLKVSNEHIAPAKAQPPYTNQIPLAFLIMEKGKMAFDYTDDEEFEKIWSTVSKIGGLIGGNLRLGELVCVPKVDRIIVLKACHEDEGHLGGDKLYERMKTLFYWETLRQDCLEYARTC
jgi:Integrase zinc binding domain